MKKVGIHVERNLLGKCFGVNLGPLTQPSLHAFFFSAVEEDFLVFFVVSWPSVLFLLLKLWHEYFYFGSDLQRETKFKDTSFNKWQAYVMFEP